jgi:hypothetical protein
MPELLTDLEALAGAWRDYLDGPTDDNPFSRDDGFRSAVKICAEQLEEALRRAREDD